MKKALILTHAGFQDHEVIYPYHSLKENNFEVTVVANQLGRFYGILGCHMVCDVLGAKQYLAITPLKPISIMLEQLITGVQL